MLMYRSEQVPRPLRELRARIAPPRKKGQHLTVDDRLGVIWGMSRGWPDYSIAEKIGFDRSTVWRYKHLVYDDPSTVFNLPLIVQAGKRDFQCQLCGETRASRMQCMRLALDHILPREMARDCDLSEVERPL